jgi:hypothetical protein
MVDAVDDERRVAVQHEKHLLVLSPPLVVLGDRLAGRELDRVDPEGADLERPPHEHPLPVRPLELLVVLDRQTVHRRSSGVTRPGDPAIPLPRQTV